MLNGLLRILFSFGLATALFVLWSVASEAGAASLLPRASYASVGPSTSVPYGWVDFCHRERAECLEPVLPALDINLNNATWAKIDRINRMVNQAIEPVTNLEHWGTMLDHWDYPFDGKGDCKVYALYKRKLLIDMGFPRQALLMTIVRDLDDEGHTILTIKTNRGEFVLDNLSEEIRPWDTTGYRFIKRQSQEDPNVWVTLESSAGAQASFAAPPTIATLISRSALAMTATLISGAAPETAATLIGGAAPETTATLIAGSAPPMTATLNSSVGP